MIIAVTGPIGCGKGALTNYLAESRGFISYSLSGIFRKVASERGISPTRKNITKLALGIFSESPKESFLAKRFMELKPDLNKDIVIEGFRRVSDLTAFKKNLPNLVIIAVDAPQEIRFQRLKERSREGDPRVFEEFIKVDDDENFSFGLQIDKCMTMAEYTIINDSSLKEFHKKIDEFLEKIRKRQ